MPELLYDLTIKGWTQEQVREALRLLMSIGDVSYTIRQHRREEDKDAHQNREEKPRG